MSLRVEIIQVTPFQQNCSIIWCDQTMQGALIDPGGDTEKLQKAITAHKVRIKKILLTHGHLDHAGGAKAMSRSLSVPVVGPHKADEFWLQGMEQQAANYGFKGVEVCTPDTWLEGGETINIGQETLEVLFCPGHTPGHLVFHHKDSRLAFVGDVLFRGSIGRTDFPRGDFETLIRSITEKLWPLGNETRFVSGHGPISDFATERASNQYVADRVLQSRHSTQ